MNRNVYVVSSAKRVYIAHATDFQREAELSIDSVASSKSLWEAAHTLGWIVRKKEMPIQRKRKKTQKEKEKDKEKTQEEKFWERVKGTQHREWDELDARVWHEQPNQTAELVRMVNAFRRRPNQLLLLRQKDLLNPEVMLFELARLGVVVRFAEDISTPARPTPEDVAWFDANFRKGKPRQKAKKKTGRPPLPHKYIDEMVDLQSQGYTFQQIADEMFARCNGTTRKTPSGRLFTAQNVAYVIKRWGATRTIQTPYESGGT